MIRHLRHDDIDKNKWDSCIRTSFNGIIYAYSWYLDVVCEEWEALVENDYDRVLPMTAGKKYAIHYLYQPYFTQQLGVFSKSILSAEVVENFLNAIPKKFKYIETNLNTLNKIDSEEFKVVPQRNYELDLIHSYENISKHYSQNTKRNIKKAEKSGLSIMKNIKPDVLIEMFRQNKGKDIPHLKADDYLMLRKLIYTCIYKGMAEVYGAYTEANELCAGAVFIQSNRKSIFLFSGLDGKGRERSAMFMIIDAYIRDHAHNHLVFDFDGSNDDDLARFYKGFGSTECTYLRVHKNNLPVIIKTIVKILKKIKA